MPFLLDAVRVPHTGRLATDSRVSGTYTVRNFSWRQKPFRGGFGSTVRCGISLRCVTAAHRAVRVSVVPESVAESGFLVAEFDINSIFVTPVIFVSRGTELRAAELHPE